MPDLKISELGAATTIGGGELLAVVQGGTTKKVAVADIGIGLTAVPNAALANSSVTVNGTSIALGASGTVAAAAGTLTGTTLASNVVSSSLTSVGTLANLTVTNTITGSVSGNAATATKLVTARAINGTNFDGSADITVTAAAGTLTGSTLASGVTASSLTSVGTLSSLTVSGDVTVDTTTLKVDSTNDRVGVGTASPSTTLDVAGGVRLANNTGNKVVYIGVSAPTANHGTSLEFQGSSGQKNWAIRTNWNSAGTIEFCPSSAAGGTSYTTPSMVIDGNGNMGLGVTPSAWGSSTAIQVGSYLSLSSAGAYGGGVGFNAYYNGSNHIYLGNNYASILEQSGGSFRFKTAASGTAGNTISFTQAMEINASGNIGIGEAPVTDYRVAIKSADSTATTYALMTRNSSSTNLLLVRSDGYLVTGTAANSPYNYTTGSAANLWVGTSGELQRSTSSIRYKSNVQDAVFGLADVLKLRPVTYQAKNSGDTVFGGLIAEEVDAAGLTPFVAYDTEGRPDAIHYGNMVALLVNAIKELNTRLVALEA